MNVYSTVFDSHIGAIISGSIWLSEDDCALRVTRNQRDFPRPVEIPFFIDTGADVTAIAESTVKSLALDPTDYCMVHGVNKSAHRPIYLVRFLLRMDSGAHTFECELLVTSMPDERFRDYPYNGLLGRDVTKHLRVVLDGPQHQVQLIEPTY